MKQIAIFTYGLTAYLLFFVAILYAMGFVANFLVPKGIDDGETGPLGIALLVNSALLGAFAIQHTIMARRGFKQWIKTVIPEAAERSTFVLLSSAILFCTFWKWQPMPDVVWRVDEPLAVAGITCLYWLGWGMVFFSSFLINHFDLFGLRQVTLALRNRPYEPLPFRMTIFYKFVRHPLLLGFLVAFWSAPVMTQGRLLFAFLTTAYILVGIQFEERDLAREHGEKYKQCQRAVPMLVPYRR